MVPAPRCVRLADKAPRTHRSALPSTPLPNLLVLPTLDSRNASSTLQVRKQIKERHDKAQADKEGSHRIAVEGQAGRSAPSRPVEKKQKVMNGAAVTAPTSREPTGQATLARKTPRSNGAGAAAGAGASSEGNYATSGSGTSRVDPEPLAREWCVPAPKAAPTNESIPQKCASIESPRLSRLFD